MLTIATMLDQIQKYWSPQWNTKLRESLLLGGLVNKEYDGQIKEKGDQITVSLLGEIDGELRTVGVDADVFESETPSPEKVDLKADKVARGTIEFESLAELQSLLDRGVLTERITRAIAKRINTYLYTLFAPSSSSPDHVLTSVTAIDAAKLAEIRRILTEAHVEGPIYGLISPQYWEGMLSASGLSSADYVEDSPVINGQKARKLFGMQLYEDNSRTGKTAKFFHPDAILYAAQTSIETKLVDLTALKRDGFLLTSRIVFGAKAGLEASLKSVSVDN